MTSEELEPQLPQTIKAAMAERQLLHERLQTAVYDHAIRLKALFEQIQTITKTFAPDKPHEPEVKEEFLRLHRTYLGLMDELKVSQLHSTALVKEIPSSKSSWQFMKNRSTPKKALQHEQRIVSAQRSEFRHGMHERAEILNRIEIVADKMNALVNAEQR